MAEKKEETPEVIKTIRERFGEASILLIGEAPNMEIDAIPTGSLLLDEAIGVGGIPYGRVTEIYGPEGSGKTTLCQHLVANAQSEGRRCAFIDMEHALDLDYVQRTGVQIEELYLSQPDTGEQALEIVEALVRSGEFGLVVVDSIAALVPHKEAEETDMGDSVMGLQARLMSQAMRKLIGPIKKTGTAVVFTNQIRMKIGVMFGNPETTPGGRAMRFYAAVRLDLRRIETLKNSGGIAYGSTIRARVVKNKVGPPFREAQFQIRYDEGISQVSEILTLAEEHGIIKRGGSFYSYNDERLAQGKENTIEELKNSPELYEEIRTQVLKALGRDGNAAAL